MYPSPHLFLSIFIILKGNHLTIKTITLLCLSPKELLATSILSVFMDLAILYSIYEHIACGSFLLAIFN